jgi:ABC-type antimicrobial peptide transport system permease subunit
MANFCLEDYEQIEKNYRRYKKSTKGKTVNSENDLTIHAYYYAAKWRENGRNQYVKKLADVIEQTFEKHNLEKTRKNLLDIVAYYKIPVVLANMENNSYF